MSLNLTAYLNARFQFSYTIANFAAVYSNLALAKWIFQIRPSAGSPVITLDFRSGGSPQNPTATVDYSAGSGSYYGEKPEQIVVRCPASVLIGLAAGTYSLDFGFVLPGADFERVDGGVIEFKAGVTIAGVIGSPPAPTGSDDTVTGGANPTPSPVPITLDAAISAANSSAMAAQEAMAGVATSAATAAAALASIATLAATATAAAASALASQNAAMAAAAQAGTGGMTAGQVIAASIFAEALTVTALNTLSGLSYVQSGPIAILIVRGQSLLLTTSNPKFTIAGTSVGWLPIPAGYPLNPGDDVAIVYSH